VQASIIAELNVSPVIDPAEQVRARIDFLKAYLRTSGAAGFVLGISGGQDSTLAGMLCRKAVEELVEEGDRARFIAVRLPYGVQRDEADAQVALAYIRPQETVVFNIGGNKFRLVAKVWFAGQAVWIKFVGTHAEYDKLDVGSL